MIDMMVCCPLDTSALPQGPELEAVLDHIHATPGYLTGRCDNCLQACYIGPRQQAFLDVTPSPLLVLCFACAWVVTANETVQVRDLTDGSVELHERGQLL